MSVDNKKKYKQRNNLKLENSTIKFLVKQYNDKDEKDLLIIPKYQRNFIWSDSQRNYLIESILLGFNIPPLTFKKEDYDEKTETFIVDGQQRILTVVNFCNDLAKLKWNKKTIDYYKENSNEENEWILDLIKETNNKTFSEFSDKNKRNIEMYKLNYWEVNPDLDEDETIQLFNRMNSNSVNLNSQEIRAAVYFSENTNYFYNEIIRYPENGMITESKLIKSFLDYKIISEISIRRKGLEEFLLFLFLYEKTENLAEKISLLDEAARLIADYDGHELNEIIIRIKKNLNNTLKIYSLINKEKWYTGRYYFLILYILIRKYNNLINDKNIDNFNLLLGKFYDFIENEDNKVNRDLFKPIHTKNPLFREKSLNEIEQFLKNNEFI